MCQQSNWCVSYGLLDLLLMLKNTRWASFSLFSTISSLPTDLLCWSCLLFLLSAWQRTRLIKVLWYSRFIALSYSYALSCEIEGLGDSSPTLPKPRKSMVKRISLWVHSQNRWMTKDLRGSGVTVTSKHIFLLLTYISNSSTGQIVSWARQQHTQFTSQRDAALASCWQLGREHGLGQRVVQRLQQSVWQRGARQSDSQRRLQSKQGELRPNWMSGIEQNRNIRYCPTEGKWKVR